MMDTGGGGVGGRTQWDLEDLDLTKYRKRVIKYLMAKITNYIPEPKPEYEVV